MRNAFIITLLAVFAVASRADQGLVAYYQVGGDAAPWVKWDTYVIDSSTLASEGGSTVRYKTFRITVHGSDPVQEIRADCKTRRRGMANDASMYSTYDGALTGEEVKAACSLAEQNGLIKR